MILSQRCTAIQVATQKEIDELQHLHKLQATMDIDLDATLNDLYPCVSWVAIATKCRPISTWKGPKEFGSAGSLGLYLKVTWLAKSSLESRNPCQKKILRRTKYQREHSYHLDQASCESCQRFCSFASLTPVHHLVSEWIKMVLYMLQPARSLGHVTKGGRVTRQAPDHAAAWTECTDACLQKTLGPDVMSLESNHEIRSQKLQASWGASLRCT